ncbi:hypothetical protein PP714_10935 [Lacticaseibacillus paracasei]|nr:hypothetical protein [Lacticaseibacillus paracasei]
MKISTTHRISSSLGDLYIQRGFYKFDGLILFEIPVGKWEMPYHHQMMIAEVMMVPKVLEMREDSGL